jgi:hypothetical protein
MLVVEVAVQATVQVEQEVMGAVAQVAQVLEVFLETVYLEQQIQGVVEVEVLGTAQVVLVDQA